MPYKGNNSLKLSHSPRAVMGQLYLWVVAIMTLVLIAVLSLDFTRHASIIGPSRLPADRLFASFGVGLGTLISPQLVV
jgi:hypothetical protein